MSKLTTETINDLLDRAQCFAENGKTSINSGHLLLAVLTGGGTAAKILNLRHLSETRVRTSIRDAQIESSFALTSIINKANQYAKTVGVNIPYAIHVLAAIATVENCLGNHILVKENMDVEDIKYQSLRNMTTSLTREHGNSKVDKRHNHTFKPKTLSGQVLNSHRINNTLYQSTIDQSSVNQSSVNQFSANTPLSNVLAETKDAGNLLNKSHLSARDMGRNLEQTQRKTIVARSTGGIFSSLNIEKKTVNRQEPVGKQEFSNKKLSNVNKDQFFILPEKQYPTLNNLGRNLSVEAKTGKFDEIIGRTREMEQIADILNKKRSNCPCLIGFSGVGKTSVIEGLASQIVKNKLPGLEDTIIIEVRSGDLLCGTSLRGALNERLDTLRCEVAKSNNRIVLFFDDMATLFSSSDGTEAVSELKSALGSGQLPCIASLLHVDYKKYIASDQTIAKLFSPVEIAEPSEKEAIEIIKAIAPSYSEHHRVKLSEKAIKAAVQLSKRYIPSRVLPEKAVALIDLAGARARRFGFEEVVENDIEEVLSEQINVPKENLSGSNKKHLLDLENKLKARIIGHDHVLTAVGETLRRNAAGFRSNRPIGSFLFLGSTGVGKTETAKALACLLFGNDNAMVRLDMSEFSEAHAVAKMIGAPPGYVGHEDGGQLTEAVKKSPYCLVLLDEIEKAHRDVIQTLLQVLDDGRLTDGKGRTIIFENTVIVMTSNLGSDLRQISSKKTSVGFGAPKQTCSPISTIVNTITQSAKAALPPELWNRIDEPLVFAPLEKKEVGEIAILILDHLSNQLLKEHQIKILVAKEVVAFLIAAGGFDEELGARPMRRTIQRLIEGPVAKLILSQTVLQKGTVNICVKNNELMFTTN